METSPTWARNEQVTVGTTSIVVVPPNPYRKVLYLKNTSDPATAQVITLVFGEKVAVAGSGIVLGVTQNTTDSNSEGYTCWKGSVQAIASAAGAKLSIFER